MKRAIIFAFCLFVSLLICAAATQSNDVFTINVSSPAFAGDVQLRYFISGEFGGYGSASVAEVTDNRIVISTTHQGQRANKLAAVAYAPGCEFVTISVDALA